MHYYPHYISDYQRDTAHLTLLEHGVYRQLLDHYYATEKPLPSDLPTLFRITRAQRKSERQAVLTVMEAFFVPTEQGLEQRRVTDEIQRLSGRVAASRKNGALGGRSRKDECAKPSSPKPTASAPPRESPTVSWAPTKHQVLISRWFNRPAAEPWTDRELAAWKAITPVPPADIALMHQRYTSPNPEIAKYRRRTLLNLLANWRSELDLARTAPQEPPDDGRVF